jgi:hypothetical protein
MRHASVNGGASIMAIRKSLSVAEERVSAETLVKFCTKRFRGNVMDAATEASAI